MSDMSDENGTTEEQPRIIELSGRAVARQMLYDMQVDDTNEVGRVLQFTPVSEEGDAIERRASALRRAEVEHLIPLFDHQARAVAAAALITSVQKLKTQHPEVEITEDLTVALYMQSKSVAISAIFAAVSTLMGNGVLTWGGDKSE